MPVAYTTNMPSDATYGKVVGRFVLAVADGSDSDRLPDARPALGWISFTPVSSSLRLASPGPTTVVKTVVKGFVNTDGFLCDPSGAEGVWLMTGVYKVNYGLAGASLSGHAIEVLPGHDDITPLDLGNAISFSGSGLAPSEYAVLANRVDALSAGSSLKMVDIGSNTTYPRPSPAQQVLWICDAGIVPANKAVGDIVGQRELPPFVGAMDAFSAPFRSLSLRRLHNAYTGSIIRVRRSSDDLEVGIGYDSQGYLNEAALLAHVGAGDGFVTTWYDQSGSARNVGQTVLSAQPQIVSAGVINKINGKPAIKFNGTTQFLTTTAGIGLYASGAASMAMVMLAAPATNATVVSEHAAASNNSLYRILRSSTAAWNVQATNDDGTAMYVRSAVGDTTFDSTQHRLFYSDSGSAISTWRDGVVVHSALAAVRSGAMTGIGKFSIGAHSAATNTNFMTGFIQELVLWGTDRVADRAAITAAQSYWVS